MSGCPGFNKWRRRWTSLLFAVLLSLMLIGGMLTCSAFGPDPFPVVTEEAVESVPFVVKNGSECLSFDFVVYEVDDGVEIPVAGYLLNPGDRIEFMVPPGDYCVYVLAKRGGEVVGDVLMCSGIPLEGIPPDSKSTLFLDDDGRYCAKNYGA